MRDACRRRKRWSGSYRDGRVLSGAAERFQGTLARLCYYARLDRRLGTERERKTLLRDLSKTNANAIDSRCTGARTSKSVTDNKVGTNTEGGDTGPSPAAERNCNCRPQLDCGVPARLSAGGPSVAVGLAAGLRTRGKGRLHPARDAQVEPAASRPGAASPRSPGGRRGEGVGEPDEVWAAFLLRPEQCTRPLLELRRAMGIARVRQQAGPAAPPGRPPAAAAPTASGAWTGARGGWASPASRAC